MGTKKTPSTAKKRTGAAKKLAPNTASRSSSNAKSTLTPKKKLAGEVYDLLTKKYNPKEVRGLPSRQKFIKNVHGEAGFPPTSVKELKQYKKELQTELGLSKRSTTRPAASSSPKTPTTKRSTQTRSASAPKPKTTSKTPAKAPTRSSSARSVTKSTTKKPAAKAGKSFFAGATEISMTANKIAVTKSASQSSKGKYSERTTREYHERTPANMRAFNDVMNNRAVKKVTVKLK